MSRILALLALCMLASGCAVGVKHDYSPADTQFGIKSTSAIAVAVHDQRPYVVSGDKQPDFVGLQRGGFGNPFDVVTASGKPLADEFADAIAYALRQGGANVTTIPVSAKESAAGVISKLRAASADRGVLLTLSEWKSDTYQNVGLAYNIALSVYDGSGRLLAEASRRGNDNLGGGFNSPEVSRQNIPKAFRQKLKELFGDPKIKAALQ